MPPDSTYTIPVIVTDGGGLTASSNASVVVSQGVQASISLQINNNSSSYTGDLDFEATFIYNGSSPSTTQTLLASSTGGSIGSASGFISLNPTPTASEIITINVERQTGKSPLTVPGSNTLTVNAYANGISLFVPKLQKVLSANTDISDSTTIILPHLAPSSGTSNQLTGSDITTNTQIGFSVEINLS